jgi:gamma-glutamylputrescine oxidase
MLGLAGAAMDHGAVICENTPVLSCQPMNKIVQIKSDNWSVRASHTIITANVGLPDLLSSTKKTIFPVFGQMVATERLGDQQLNSAMSQDNLAVTDMRMNSEYFRVTGDGRLLFGGGSLLRKLPPRKASRQLRHALKKRFPMLASTNIDFEWTGTAAGTLNEMPEVGRPHPNITFAHGVGVLMAIQLGRVLSEDILGHSETFNHLTKLNIPTVPFSGSINPLIGRVADFYYSCADRLG